MKTCEECKNAPCFNIYDSSVCPNVKKTPELAKKRREEVKIEKVIKKEKDRIESIDRSVDWIMEVFNKFCIKLDGKNCNFDTDDAVYTVAAQLTETHFADERRYYQEEY